MICKDCEFNIKESEVTDELKQKLNETYENYVEVLNIIKQIYNNTVICSKHAVIRVNDNLKCIDEIYEEL